MKARQWKGDAGRAGKSGSKAKFFPKIPLHFDEKKGIIISAKGELVLQAERKALPSTRTPDADNAAVGITA